MNTTLEPSSTDDRTQYTQLRAAIWVERLSRTGEVLSRERCVSNPITIGRGYHNDVIIDDPTVAEAHLRIVRDEQGQLHAEDLGTLNGLSFSARGETLRKAPLQGDRPLRIGATWLRIRSADHPVPAEQPLVHPKRLWPYSLALLIAAIGLDLLDLWRGQTTDIQWVHQAWQTLMLLAAVLGWSSLWALISRIFTHHSHYGQHLLIALVGLMSLSLTLDLLPLLTYSFSWHHLPAAGFALTTVLIAIAVHFHLHLVLPKHRRMQATILAGLVALVIGLDVLKLNLPGNGAPPTFVIDDLQPPALRLARPQPIDRFFADSQALKAQIEAARKNEQPDDDEQLPDDGDIDDGSDSG